MLFYITPERSGEIYKADGPIGTFLWVTVGDGADWQTPPAITAISRISRDSVNSGIMHDAQVAEYSGSLLCQMFFGSLVFVP